MDRVVGESEKRVYLPGSDIIGRELFFIRKDRGENRSCLTLISSVAISLDPTSRSLEKTRSRNAQLATLLFSHLPFQALSFLLLSLRK